jgi:hypothetical protein
MEQHLEGQLPLSIINLVADGVSQMRSHREHHFDWRVRRDLYRALHALPHPQAYAVHGWLAVITAEYVLPIFTTAIDDDPLPQKLVACAREVMEGVVPRNSVKVQELLEEGYQGTGIDCLDWRDTVNYAAEYVGTATYKALLEANGAHDLLAHTDQHVRGQTVQVFHWQQTVAPSEVTDYHIAELAAFSDTASAAAIAYACHSDRYQLEPQRLKAFWEWWAHVALPAAWQRAMSEIPQRIRINHDKHYANQIGRTVDGCQFLLTTPFAHDPHQPELIHEFVACYLFDANGQLLEARIDELGLRDDLDNTVAEQIIAQRLGELGPITYADIQIAPFQVHRFGVTFGLTPHFSAQDKLWRVILEPGNYMSFQAPWDSGVYDT